MHFIGSVPVNTNGRDPLVFVVVFVFLAAMTLLASYLSARRVTRIDPVEVLREE
jgi:ABC-type lipoprotein release transport system permease subunit